MAQQTFSGVPGDFSAGQVLTAADMDKLREFLLYLIKEGDDTDTGEVSPMILDLGNDRVGINIAAPDNTLHVLEASAGTVAAHADTQVAIENSGTAGIQFLTNSGEENRIIFGDAADNDIGGITYDHDGNSMRWTTNAAERMRLTSAGRLGIATTEPLGTLDLGTGTGRMLFVYHGDAGANTAGFGTNVSGGSYELTAWTPYSSGKFAIGQHDGTDYYAIAEFNRSALGGRLKLFGVGTTEGGELQFGQGTSYSPDMIMHRYADDILWTWGGVTKYEFEDGGAAYNTTGTWGTISSEVLKQDIADARPQIDDIKAVRFVNFRLKADVAEQGDDAPVLLGVVAEELEAAGMGGLVRDMTWKGDDGEPTTMKAAKTSVLAIKGIKALQELITRVEALEAA